MEGKGVQGPLPGALSLRDSVMETPFLTIGPSCPKCQVRMRVISFIEDGEVIKNILKHLGLCEVRLKYGG